MVRLLFRSYTIAVRTTDSTMVPSTTARDDGLGESKAVARRFFHNLLTFAGHARIPVHKGAVGVVAPRPYVQLEEGRQAEPVRAANELERLPFEHRRTVVEQHPRGRVHYVLDADQAETGRRRLIDQRLRTRRVDLPVAH